MDIIEKIKSKIDKVATIFALDDGKRYLVLTNQKGFNTSYYYDALTDEIKNAVADPAEFPKFKCIYNWMENN